MLRDLRHWLGLWWRGEAQALSMSTAWREAWKKEQLRLNRWQ